MQFFAKILILIYSITENIQAMSGNLKCTSKIKGNFFLISPWQQITLGFGTLENGLRWTVIDIFVDLVKVKLK